MFFVVYRDQFIASQRQGLYEAQNSNDRGQGQYMVKYTHILTMVHIIYTTVCEQVTVRACSCKYALVINKKGDIG